MTLLNKDFIYLKLSLIKMKANANNAIYPFY